MYHFCGNCQTGEVVDRVLINMDLSISSHFTERRTYSGIHSISQFDLSFRISGECSENYYGPQCNVFCLGEEGVSTCTENGRLMCVNSNLSPDSNCTQCLEEGRDPDNNCNPEPTQGKCIHKNLETFFTSSPLYNACSSLKH